MISDGFWRHQNVQRTSHVWKRCPLSVSELATRLRRREFRGKKPVVQTMLLCAFLKMGFVVRKPTKKKPHRLNLFVQTSLVRLLDGWCLQHHHLYKSQVEDLKNTLLDLQVKMDDPPASGANAVPNVTWLKGSGWRGVGGVPDLHFLVFGIFHSHFLVRRSSKSEEWQVLSWKDGMFGIF